MLDQHTMKWGITMDQAEFDNEFTSIVNNDLLDVDVKAEQGAIDFLQKIQQQYIIPTQQFFIALPVFEIPMYREFDDEDDNAL